MIKKEGGEAQVEGKGNEMKETTARGTARSLPVFMAVLCLALFMGMLAAPQNAYATNATNIDDGTDPGSFDAAPGATDQFINGFAVSKGGSCTGTVSRIRVTTSGTGGTTDTSRPSRTPR
jgi:hypothetical protein